MLIRDYKAGTRVLDFATGRQEVHLADAGQWFGEVAVSPDGRHVAHADSEGGIRLADASSGREVRILARPLSKEPDNRTVMEMEYSPDGRTLATAYHSGTVRVYEVATGSERFRFAGHTDAATGLSFSPDGTRLCSGRATAPSSSGT